MFYSAHNRAALITCLKICPPPLVHASEVETRRTRASLAKAKFQAEVAAIDLFEIIALGAISNQGGGIDYYRA